MEELEELLLKMESEREEYKNKIYKVPIKVINYYIDYWNRNILDDNRKKLYSYDIESGKYIAIDNTTNNCWTKQFENEIDTLNWLGVNL